MYRTAISRMMEMMSDVWVVDVVARTVERGVMMYGSTTVVRRLERCVDSCDVVDVLRWSTSGFSRNSEGFVSLFVEDPV